MTLQIVILAAGQGKRMQSSLPKVLHPIAGKPMLQHVLETAQQLTQNMPCVVYGHQGHKLREAFPYLTHLMWVEQAEQLGTGHAVLQTLPVLQSTSHVLVLYGDVPLISSETLAKLIKTTPKHALGVITAHLNNPHGYGRIKRNAKQEVIAIVEEKDANETERKINEVNTGIYYVPTKQLQQWLPRLKNTNMQKEYYLTDIIPLAVEDNMTIHTLQPHAEEEIQGVNDKLQLAKLERYYQLQQAEKLLQKGVTLLDPARIDIRGEVEVGQDVTIDINVILEGKIKIGNGCRLGANSVLRNVTLGDNVEIKSHCVLEDATVSDAAVIGPFARLRPGTKLGPQVHIGNFVEVKNSSVGASTKINHLSYIGDTELGKRVNVGAGTITCNYDGANKHKTTIKDDVHIGSDTLLVAPVTIGEGATIGAGSTLIKDAPAHQLTLTNRLEQRAVKDWERPK